MRHLLQRHPVPVDAYFTHALVVTYAYPKEVLRPLLPPGLRLDTYDNLGFLAVAMVQTTSLRPAGAPWFLGQDFFLTGYRIFTLLDRPGRRPLRGLRIIRSDSNRWRMVIGGNLLTHYAYQHCHSAMTEQDGRLQVSVRTRGGAADIDLTADLGSAPAPLPAGSPFASARDARRFAGPLPFTFDYESETHSIVAIKAKRQAWDPQAVDVNVAAMTFLQHPSLALHQPILANAFHVANVPYRWLRGRRIPLEQAA